MAQNIFQTIAEGIGNTNQNVVELFKLVEELSSKVDAIHSVLFPNDIEVANEGGEPTNKL